MADYIVTHRTTYTYSEKVSHCHNIAYLLPQSNFRQVCEGTEIMVTPTAAVRAEHSDYFGNRFCYFAVEEPHRVLSVTAKTRVHTQPTPAIDYERSPAWEKIVEQVKNPTTTAGIAAAEFVLPSPFVVFQDSLRAYAAQSFSPSRPILTAVLDFAHRIQKDFRYEQKSTTILTPLSEVFQKRRGVCQDFAHLSIAALRALGIPTRYVSGYIETYPPAGKPKLRGSDASHAWISVYAGEQGWFDFDPTNGKAITEEFIVTACGRDFGDVSPLKGILFGGGKHTLKVEVDVHRLTS